MSRFRHVILLFLICLGGLTVHALFYLHGRPMWSDEAALAVNVMEKSYVGLAGPLNAATRVSTAAYAASLSGPFGGYPFDQVCPIAFLWLSKAALAVCGLSVKTFQLVPLAAYTLFLIVAAWWLSRAAGAWTGAVCLIILSLAAPLIEYSTEFKQYTLDLLMSLLILAALYPNGKPVRLNAVRCIILAVLGSISVWSSLSAIIILGGVMTPLAYLAWRDRSWPDLWLLSALGTVCLFSFGVECCTVLRNTTTNASLYEFHRASFGPLPPKSPADLMWYFEALLGPFGTTLGFDLLAAGGCAIAFVLGVQRLAQSNRPLLWALLGPIALTFLAAQLHKYPWGAHLHADPWDARLLIFLAFNLAYLMAEGAVVLVRLLAERSRAAALVAALCLTIALLLPAQREFKRFSPTSPFRKNLSVEGVMAQIQHDKTAYDCVYMPQTTGLEFKFFSLVHHYRWEKELLVGHVGVEDEQPDDLPRSLDALAEDIGQAVQHRRTWIILSENHWLGLRERYIERVLDQNGKQVKRVSDRGAVALLYDFSPPVPSVAPL